MGREIRDGSRDPQGGPERVGGPLGRSGTGRSTLGEVWDRSEDPRGGPGRVGVLLGWSTTGRSTLGEVRYRSEDPRRGPRRVGGPSRRSGRDGEPSRGP